MSPVRWSSEFRVLVNRHADRIAVVDEDGSATYREIFARAAGIARALLELGVDGRACVATRFRNGIDAVAATFAVMISGATEVPVNPALSAADCDHCLAVSGARIVLTNSRLADDLAGSDRRIVCVDRIATAAIDCADFPDADADAPARIIFTSGTTGKPKGAVHTQRGRWTANLLLCASLPYRLSAENRVLLMTPYSHGASLLTHAYLSHGASVCLLDGVDTARVLQVLESGSCDAMFAPPTVLAKIVSAIEPGRRLPPLRTIYCGTAPLKAELYARARAIFGPVVRITYGKSEMVNPITVLEPDETDACYASRDESGCVGHPAAGVEIAIRRDDGGFAATGETGEVLLRSQHLMSGYLTLDGFQPLGPADYHDTGDLGHIDRLGRLHLTGRMADIIKTGGYKVSPDEIERAIAAAVAPAEVAVVGIPSDYWGEVILAAVERPMPDWEDRLKPVLHEMTDYKCPRFLVAVDELPRNSIGKIMRSRLRTEILSRFSLIDGSRPRLEPT
jgi:acyl-CoA synthetase (AMP-forming)/AMP-acid ligase II